MDRPEEAERRAEERGAQKLRAAFMSLRRGLVRVWVLASILWVAWWIWKRSILCELDLPFFGRGPWCTYRASDWAVHATTVAITLGVPILVGLVGWTCSGFVPVKGQKN